MNATVVVLTGKCKKPAIMNGNYPDDFYCDIFHFFNFMQSFGFEYICFAITLLIIVISIFGKIKENYKWFILNQAIWDLWVEYDYNCAPPYENFNNEGISPIRNKNTCLHKVTYGPLNDPMYYTILFLPNFMFCLLTYMRFLAMFYPQFYGRHVKGYKILIIIILWNLISLFCVNFFLIFYNFWSMSDSPRNCQILDSTRKSAEYMECTSGPLFYEVNLILKSFHYVSYIIFLILAAGLSFAVLIKVIWQFKYQKKIHHSKQWSSFKIACILLFQCLVSIIFITPPSLNNILYYIISNILYKYTGNRIANSQQIAMFFRAFLGNYKTMNLMRIFLDGIVLLVVLSGYRESMIVVVKWIKNWIWGSSENFGNRRNRHSMVTIAPYPSNHT